MRSNHNFPSQVVSDAEKSSHDYGLEVAKAIEAEFQAKIGEIRLEAKEANEKILEASK